MCPKPYVAVKPPKEIRHGLELEHIFSQEYTADQVDTALMLLVKLGNTRQVCDVVNERFGTKLNPARLADWKTRQYPNRYMAALVELQPEMREQAIRNYSEAVTRLQSVQEQAIDKVAESIEHLEPKDAGNALRNVSIALGVNTDKHSILTGLPTSTVLHVTADDVIRNLKSKSFVTIEPDHVDGTVEDDAA